MEFYFVRTNLREFYVEASGIGSALDSAMQLCLDRIEWILECEKRQTAYSKAAA